MARNMPAALLLLNKRADAMHKLESALISQSEPLPDLPTLTEPVKIRAGGSVGRKAGLKTVYIGKIVDWQKVLHHFSGHQQLRHLLQKLVDADVRSNKTQCSIPESSKKGRCLMSNRTSAPRNVVAGSTAGAPRAPLRL